MFRRLTVPISIGIVCVAGLWWALRGTSVAPAFPSAESPPVSPALSESRGASSSTRLSPTSLPAVLITTIRVLSEQGESIATAAAYCASSKARSVNRTSDEIFRAQPDGNIDVTGRLPEGCDEIGILASGYEPYFIKGVLAGEKYVVQLRKSLSLVLRCRDRSGRPLAGVGFVFSRQPVWRDDLVGRAGHFDEFPSGDNKWCVVHAETDVQGVAVFSSVTAGRAWMGLTHGPFVIVVGLDRPWIDLSDRAQELELTLARYYVAIATLEDPNGDVTGGVISTSADGVMPGQFNPWLLGKAEFLRRRFNTDLCEAVVFTRDCDSPLQWPITTMAARLQLADTTVQEEPIPIQDPSSEVFPTVVRPRPLREVKGTGRILVKLRDVAGNSFDLPYMLSRIENDRPPVLVQRRTGRVATVPPGRYLLTNIPSARLWRPIWSRDLSIMENEEAAVDVVIPEVARLAKLAIVPLQGSYPIIGKAVVSWGSFRAEHDLVGEDIMMVLPESPVQVSVEGRVKGKRLGTFDLVSGLQEVNGRIELRVDDSH